MVTHMPLPVFSSGGRKRLVFSSRLTPRSTPLPSPRIYALIDANNGGRTLRAAYRRYLRDKMPFRNMPAWRATYFNDSAPVLVNKRL